MVVHVRVLDAAGLVDGVTRLSSPETPIVTSKRLKALFDAEGTDWGRDIKGWKGRYFDAADDACTGAQVLTKWKRTRARNAPIGWSLPRSFEPAQAWAETHGWKQVSK